MMWLKKGEKNTQYPMAYTDKKKKKKKKTDSAHFLHFVPHPL